MARADSLLGVAIAALPDSASLDARLLRAFITRDPVAQRGVLAELRAQQDLDIYNECNRVAVYTHNLRDAETVCGLLIEPNRQITGQDAGRMTLAYLAMTQGQRSRARQQLAAMPAHARALRAELGAFFECFPMFPVDTIAARRTRDSLLVVDPSEAERALPTIGSAPAHVQLRLYFLARLDRCLGDSAAATAHIAELRRVSGAHTGRQALAESLRLSLDAELAGRSGAASQALGAIERVDAEHDTLNYDFLARIVNRFVRGEALVQSGRVDEGVSWLGSLEGNYLADLLLAPQGHLMSARALRERKDVNGEIGELTRALALWREPDVELRAVIGEAQARRSRLKH